MKKCYFSLWLWILFFPVTYYEGPVSDHFDGSHFFNPWAKREGTFLSVLKWKMGPKGKTWPKHVDNLFADLPPARVEGDKLRLSFVGHATVLIQTEGLNILTDPVWSQKIGPLPGLMLQRVTDPGISFDHLPKIDLILLSHNHYDHLDLKTLQQIWQRDRPLILCPLGNDTLLRKLDSSIQSVALDWEEQKQINGATITLEPAQHWSSRGLWDRDKALWGSYVIQTTSGTLYFGGDSGYYQPLYQKLREKYGSFRLALLPIGSYEPRWFMRYAHFSPEDAVQAHIALGKPPTLAIHFATFHLADEGYDDPVVALSQAKQFHHLPENTFRALSPGQSWVIP